MTTLVFKSRLLKNIKLLEDFSRKNHKKTTSETSRLICENLYLLRQNAQTAAEFSAKTGRFPTVLSRFANLLSEKTFPTDS